MWANTSGYILCERVPKIAANGPKGAIIPGSNFVTAKHEISALGSALHGPQWPVSQDRQRERAAAFRVN